MSSDVCQKANVLLLSRQIPSPQLQRFISEDRLNLEGNTKNGASPNRMPTCGGSYIVPESPWATVRFLSKIDNS
jgi:hypothetical protein